MQTDKQVMLDLLVSYLKSHPQHALYIGSLLAFMESIPILGHFIPGFIIMPPIGFLIAEKILPLSITFFTITCAGILGDCLSFWLGKKATPILEKHYPKLQKYRENYSKITRK